MNERISAHGNTQGDILDTNATEVKDMKQEALIQEGQVVYHLYSDKEEWKATHKELGIRISPENGEMTFSCPLNKVMELLNAQAFEEVQAIVMRKVFLKNEVWPENT